MTEDEKTVLRWVSLALQAKRNRYGAIQMSSASENMRRAGLKLKIPHGGEDIPDQAAMVIQALIGDPIQSRLEWGQ